jgi:mannosyltransferase
VLRAAPGHLATLARTVWLVPAVVTGLLGLWRIGRPALWQDELVTLDVAGREPGQILRLVSHVDAVHGLYYLLMHGWTAVFGDSVTALRLPSVLAMAVAAGCVAATGRVLFDHTTGLLAGLAFAAVPAVSRFAQEARSYAMVVCGVALATLLLVRAVRAPGLRRWAGYGACVATVGAFNAVALTVLLGHAAMLLILWWPERHAAAPGRLGRAAAPVGFASAALTGAVVVLPVLLYGSRQSQRQIGWIEHTAAWTVWPQVTGSHRTALLLAALACLAWLGPRRPAAAVTAVILLPPAAVWAASTGPNNYFFSKYLLFVLPAVTLLAGAGAGRLRPRALSAAALVVLAVAGLPAQVAVRDRYAHSWYTFPAPRVGTALDYAEAADIIEAGYRPGDAVVYGRVHWWWMVDVGVTHQLRSGPALRDVFAARPAADDGDLFTAQCPDPAACLGTEQRIWLVVPYQLGNPLQMVTATQARLLEERFDVVRVWHPPGMTVALLARRDG